MKTRLSALAALLTITLHTHGAVLAPGTLADYLALGPGGGTIGTTTFSSFLLQPLQTGATAIAPADILVTPINLAGSPTLQFGFTQAAAAGGLFEMHISYQVSALALLGASVALGNVTALGDAAVTAVLALTGPSPVPPSLIALETSFISIPSDATAFASAAALNVDFGVVIDGGLAGSASLGLVTNQFTVPFTASVPDSGTSLLLLASGLCALGIMRHLLPVASRV